MGFTNPHGIVYIVAIAFKGMFSIFLFRYSSDFIQNYVLTTFGTLCLKQGICIEKLYISAKNIVNCLKANPDLQLVSIVQLKNKFTQEYDYTIVAYFI